MDRKVSILLIAFAIAALAQSYYFVRMENTPLGVDWNHFHSEAVLAYARGDFTYLFKYPPAFEMLLVPLAFLLIDRWFQYILVPLSILEAKSIVSLVSAIYKK